MNIINQSYTSIHIIIGKIYQTRGTFCSFPLKKKTTKNQSKFTTAHWITVLHFVAYVLRIWKKMAAKRPVHRIVQLQKTHRIVKLGKIHRITNDLVTFMLWHLLEIRFLRKMPIVAIATWRSEVKLEVKQSNDS